MPLPAFVLPVVGGVALIGGALALRVRAVAKQKVPVTLPPGTSATPIFQPDTTLKSSIAAGLKAGTTLIGTNGVPFDPAPPPGFTNFIPGQLLKSDGTLDLLVTDLITVDAPLLAQSLRVAQLGSIPTTVGQAVLMEITKIVDPSKGPVIAISRDPRLNTPQGFTVFPSMIGNVQPADAAVIEAAAAAQAVAGN